MFGKVKEFVIDKAFSLAYMRYDQDSSGKLNKNQITSFINDAFQLLKIQRQVSWLQTAALLKLFDDDDDEQIDKQQARQAFKNALAKFGGFSGFAKFAGFGKTSSGLPMEGEPDYSNIPIQQVDEQEKALGKISGKVDYVPPEDIDESALAKLPPVGQNLKVEDLKKLEAENNQNQPVKKQQPHHSNQPHTQPQHHQPQQPQQHQPQQHQQSQNPTKPVQQPKKQEQEGGFLL